MTSTSQVDLVAAVRDALADCADPERAAAQRAYMASAMPFLGVSAPRRRQVLRPLLADPGLAPAGRGEWEGVVRRLWDGARYREERYAALDLLTDRRRRPWWDRDVLPLVEHLVRTGAWWDLVDPVSRVLGEALSAQPDEVGGVVRAWSREDDLWLRRAAIISQLGRGEQTDRELLTDTIAVNLGDRELFIRKAIGWSLRQFARTDPEWVRDFVAAHESELSPLSRREALRWL